MKLLAILWIIVATVVCTATGKSSKSTDRGIAEEVFAAWSSHDPNMVVTFYTDDVVYEDVPLGRTNHGTVELRKFVEDTFAAFPDLKAQLVSSSICGSHGVSEVVWTATDKGYLKTDKKFSIHMVSLFELRGGKLWRNKDFYDLASIMRQLGKLPPEAAAPVRESPAS